ncbi:MAG: LysR family transcriptional regulator [Casimicrobiaceae bacterium]
MENLTAMAVFAKVVEENSLSGAARTLGLSKSSVSKLVAGLEKSLGAQLLNRTTRQMSPTEAGAAFYDHCARIVEEMEEAKLAVSRLHSEPRGLLKISTSVAFGTLHIAPLFNDFLARYPEVKVDMTISDRFVDLADEGYDVAIRIARDPGLNIVARKLAPVHRKLCATPDYFARHGVPQAVADLARHNCLTYTYVHPKGLWRLQGPEREISVPVSGNLRLNDDEALSQAVLGGLGIAALPTFIVGKDLQAGRLQCVLSEYTLPEQDVYAVYLPTRHLSAKVRAFIDFLLERFGPEPYWDRIDHGSGSHD